MGDIKTVAARIKWLASELAADMTTAVNMGAEVSVEFKAIDTSNIGKKSVIVVPDVSVAVVARETL